MNVLSSYSKKYIAPIICLLQSCSRILYIFYICLAQFLFWDILHFVVTIGNKYIFSPIFNKQDISVWKKAMLFAYLFCKPLLSWILFVSKNLMYPFGFASLTVGVHFPSVKHSCLSWWVFTWWVFSFVYLVYLFLSQPLQFKFPR